MKLKETTMTKVMIGVCETKEIIADAILERFNVDVHPTHINLSVHGVIATLVEEGRDEGEEGVGE